MSAICGIVRFDGKPVDSIELKTMVESSPYRGPDGVGYHVHENAGFAHLAFHVTPESVHEKQPLTSEDGRLVLVADVRFDNRDDLFKKLEIRDQPERVITDPEVLLAAYLKWGARCVEHFLGDFVFSIWDQQKKRLFLARDPLGAFGIAYYRKGPLFICASEISAILDLPQVTARVNEDVVLKALVGMQMGQQETFFESIHNLPPAHCMLISDNDSRTWKYWEINPDDRVRYKNEDQYTDHFLQLLNQAVSDRLRSTGPVGISLSGGSDSTLLAALAAKQLSSAPIPQRLKSFSYVFDHFKECDERKYIYPTVQKYDIDASYLQSDHLWTFAHLEKQEIARDFFWSNCFCQLPVSIAHAAKTSGCRVLIDGMFGDALFCEPSLFAADLIRQGRFLHLYQLLRANPDGINWKDDLFNHGLRPLLPHWLRRAYRILRPVDIKAEIPGLAPARLKRLGELRQAEFARPPLSGLSPGRATRHRRIFQSVWAQGFAATRSKPYQQNGIERVSPYFDRRLVEFALAIPTEQLSHVSRPRKLQNEAMRRVLPETVYGRNEKTSFRSLLEAGILDKEHERINKLLEQSLTVQQGWADENWLNREKHRSTSIQTDVFALSQFLHLELWLRAGNPALKKGRGWSEPYFHQDL